MRSQSQVPSHRALFITQEPEDPVTRYRVGQYLPSLQAQGVEPVCIPWPRDSRACAEVIERASGFDSVVISRRLPSLTHLKKLRRSARKLAFDFDDWITRTDSRWGWTMPLLDKVIEFWAMMRAADVITAGNAVLADLARSYAPDAHIEIVPTTIDLTRYPSRSNASPKRETSIGWIGQSTTAVYLKKLTPALLRVARLQPDVRFAMISGKLPRMPGLECQLLPWSLTTEVQHLQSLDIGLAPLSDDRWTRGKCGLRLLQYLASETAAIASPVGMQKDVIDADAALPASSLDEWRRQMERLILNPDERRAMAKLGRGLVESKFSVKTWAPIVARLWHGIESSATILRPAS
jgi:glycosyltransferase involved in cell wall biosynthesis